MELKYLSSCDQPRMDEKPLIEPYGIEITKGEGV